MYNLGLYYNKELVAIMTFCRPRIFMGHKKYESGEYELSRYATSKSITGGASKLLNYFINEFSPKKIISYADRRWSSNINNTMYDMLGFKKVKVNKAFAKDNASQFQPIITGNKIRDLQLSSLMNSGNTTNTVYQVTKDIENKLNQQTQNIDKELKLIQDKIKIFCVKSFYFIYITNK